jgi:hypothetical protein
MVLRARTHRSSDPVEGLDETVGDCDSPVVLVREAISTRDGSVVLLDERVIGWDERAVLSTEGSGSLGS